MKHSHSEFFAVPAPDVAAFRFWAKVLFFASLLADGALFLVMGHSMWVTVYWADKTIDGLVIQWAIPLTIATVVVLLARLRPCSLKQGLWLGGLGLALVAWLLVFDSYLFAALSFSTKANVLLLPLTVYVGMRAFHDLWQERRGGPMAPAWAHVWPWTTLTVASLIVGTAALLRLNGMLLPLTFDYYLYHIDAAFPGLARWAALQVGGDQTHALGWATHTAYDVLGILFFPLLALLVGERKERSLNVWRTLFVPYVVAALCYLWLPATGPGVAIDGYPATAAMPQDLQMTMVSVVSAPRNAMPSIHLSSAIWIFMLCAALRHKIFFVFGALFVAITAWATLAIGEHYLIDLVVAMSFAPALGLFLINPPRWKIAQRWQHHLQWTSIATFISWMLLLRLAPEWLAGHSDVVRLLAAWSVAVGLWLLVLHVRCVWREEDTNEALLSPELAPKPFIAPQFLPAELKGRRWLVGIFFFSGFAGLVYEVVYAKALGVTFGGTALAANTVLMTYMGGMALGAWLGGILAVRSTRPLLLYAFFEAAIGIYAAMTPQLFDGIQHLYVALALDTPPDAPMLTGLRMALGAAVLGVPTVLMGATLPLVFQCLRGMGIPTARAIAPLYAANVLGAAAGALVAGYALLPAVGRSGGTLLAAVISLMVALYVIDKIKRGADGTSASSFVLNSVNFHSNPLSEGERLNARSEASNARLGLAALTVLTVGGVVTLALEVVFMHLLAVVAGNSVYAFGLMLATFLLGLGLGSTVGEGLMRTRSRVALVLGAQCGIALAILLTSFVWDGLADYMGSFGYAQQQGVFLSFSARELVRALVCALAMLPPAFFIGLSYPAAMGLAADWLAARRFGGEAARGVGLASALNTLGNIAGVLLAGFWWLPQYGSRNVLLGLAVAAVLLAALFAWASNRPQEGSMGRRWLPVGAMAGALALFPAQWNYTALSTGGNVYFYAQNWGEVTDHAESVEGGLTTVAQAQTTEGKKHLTLLTNGKFQGNNSEGGEMVAQESIALIPLMHTTQRNEALVIGYGTGMTARVLQDQGFAHLDVAEISRDIVVMADKHFSNINDGISHHPAVQMHYTDGRNYLLTQTKKYDLISLEISSIWFAGAANLYNREFYQLANARLRPQGVLQQWVQLHHMRPMDFLYIMGSVRSVFKNVWIYVSGGQGIIVASNDSSAVGNDAAMQKLIAGHTISALKAADLPDRLVAGPAQVDAMIRRFDPSMRFFVSTDSNLYLEYATPKGNAMREDSMPLLIDLLKGEM